VIPVCLKNLFNTPPCCNQNLSGKRRNNINGGYRQDFALKKNLFFMLFSIFLQKFLTAIFLVIGFKRGNSPAMGEKKNAMTLSLEKAENSGKSKILPMLNPHIFSKALS
jgi:hypothetical protein